MLTIVPESQKRGTLGTNLHLLPAPFCEKRQVCFFNVFGTKWRPKAVAEVRKHNKKNFSFFAKGSPRGAPKGLKPFIFAMRSHTRYIRNIRAIPSKLWGSWDQSFRTPNFKSSETLRGQRYSLRDLTRRISANSAHWFGLSGPFKFL